MNRILEALKSREWILFACGEEGEEIYMCPTCDQVEANGHAPDCTYPAAIREAESLPKRLSVEELENELNLVVLMGPSTRRLAAKALHSAIYGEEPDHE